MTNKTDMQQQFKTVHLVVDMQHMWAEQLTPEDRSFLPAAIEKFVRATHETIPPIYVESQDEDMWRADVDARQYDTAIEHVYNPSVSGHLGRSFKTASSAFQHGVHSDLNVKLKNLGVEEVIISGGFTRRCVWETAVDAAKCGFKVTILDDLCRDSVHLSASKNFPPVTSELCAAAGITLGNSGKYNNAEQFGGAAHSMAAFRM